MRKLLFLLCLTIGLNAQTATTAIVLPMGSIKVAFSDQGPTAIKTLTGHKPPKGYTILGVTICNTTGQSITTSEPQVRAAIEMKSSQHPRVVLNSLVSLILASYQSDTLAQRLIKVGSAGAATASLLIASRVIAASTAWGVGAQLFSPIMNAWIPAIPGHADLVTLGQSLLANDINLGPAACKEGLLVAASSKPLVNEEVTLP
jgi:hypothetical protein